MAEDPGGVCGSMACRCATTTPQPSRSATGGEAVLPLDALALQAETRGASGAAVRTRPPSSSPWRPMTAASRSCPVSHGSTRDGALIGEDMLPLDRRRAPRAELAFGPARSSAASLDRPLAGRGGSRAVHDGQHPGSAASAFRGREHVGPDGNGAPSLRHALRRAGRPRSRPGADARAGRARCGRPRGVHAWSLEVGAGTDREWSKCR